MKEITIVLIIALSGLFTTTVWGMGLSKLVLHLKNENKTITLRGDQCGGGAVFNFEQVSCACITGLWAIYRRDCDLAHVLLGASNGQCFHLDFPVHKASLISPPEVSRFTSSATAFDQNVASIGGKFFTNLGIPSTTYFVSAGFPVVITTGIQSWRLPHKNLCMKPTNSNSHITNYCLFKHSIYEEYRLTDESCANEDKIISPLICTPFENVDSTSCIDVEESHSRVKRDTGGRTFLDAVTGLQNNATPTANVNMNNEDENHGINNTIERPMINSEIWNFMTIRAQEKLLLRDPASLEGITLGFFPGFEFLQIAKQIQQKACPDHYVPDDHYDIAVGAFESLQRNHFRYTDPFLDAATFARIKDALNTCLNNIHVYPFLERIGKKTVSCNGTNPITHGSYEMFDKILELSLAHDQASRVNEPIVETVWKVFIHAHSACYEYFKNNYNDHHRLTTVMLPLFINDVNDMWFSVTELKEDIYSGFLGDAIDLMDSVAFCAMYSRLESGYPWDLPRPKKDNARRKREVTDGYSGYECMDDYDARNFCPIPEDSLATSLRDDSEELDTFAETSIKLLYDG